MTLSLDAHPIRRHLSLLNEFLSNLSKKTRLSKNQIVFFSIFPLIIVLGQFMSYFSPDQTIHNYFTSRGNLVNTYFVKKGWLWTIITYIYMIYNKIKRKGFIHKKVLLYSILRVFLITLCWILFTQWCFGPPLMDKIFVLTGGQCSNIQQSRIPESLKHLFGTLLNSEDTTLLNSKSISSSTCKRLKGTWEGGHDPSGHVFLLTLSSSVLLFELVALYSDDDNLYNELLTSRTHPFQLLFHPLILTLMVVFMGLCMLLMTTIKYHSLQEQLAGLFVAFIAIWLVNIITDAIKF